MFCTKKFIGCLFRRHRWQLDRMQGEEKEFLVKWIEKHKIVQIGDRFWSVSIFKPSAIKNYCVWHEIDPKTGKVDQEWSNIREVRKSYTNRQHT